MAIFGMGAQYDGEDIFDMFFSQSCACVGHSEKAAPPAHAILRQLRAGDYLYQDILSAIRLNDQSHRHSHGWQCVQVQNPRCRGACYMGLDW